MDKIKDVLKSKMRFIQFNASDENYLKLEMEFIDFIFETPELAKIMKRLVTKGKVDMDWLRNAFITYAVTQYNPLKKENFKLPAFYNKEMEGEYHLLRFLKETVEQSWKETQEDPTLLDIKKLEESVFGHASSDSFYHLKKLYTDVLQEIDLLDTQVYKKEEKQISLDEKKGILLIGASESELSKKGKETDALRLVKTLLRSEKGMWNFSEKILSDWGYSDEDIDQLPKNKVYDAARKVRDIIQEDAGIDDFLEFNTSKFRICSKYLY